MIFSQFRYSHVFRDFRKIYKLQVKIQIKKKFKSLGTHQYSKGFEKFQKCWKILQMFFKQTQ